MEQPFCNDSPKKNRNTFEKLKAVKQCFVSKCETKSFRKLFALRTKKFSLSTQAPPVCETLTKETRKLRETWKLKIVSSCDDLQGETLQNIKFIWSLGDVTMQ